MRAEKKRWPCLNSIEVQWKTAGKQHKATGKQSKGSPQSAGSADDQPPQHYLIKHLSIKFHMTVKGI